MTFATQFIEDAEPAYAFTQQTVIWNGETCTNALMEKFTLSFSKLKNNDTALKIKVNEEIPDNLDFGDTIESFLGNIEIPLVDILTALMDGDFLQASTRCADYSRRVLAAAPVGFTSQAHWRCPRLMGLRLDEGSSAFQNV